MEDIKYVQLSEIAELITKGTTPTTLGYEFQDEGVKFLKIECFDENGGFIENKAAHISEECHEKLKRSQLKAGDILFSIAGAIGRVAIVSEEMLPANTNQALAIIRISDEQVYLPYIKLILTSPIVIEQFERKKQGVAQLNLSLKDINEISIPLPIKEKQIELAELFDKVVRVISKRSMELSLLNELIKARFVELFGDPASNPNKWPETTIGEECFYIKDGPHKSLSDIGKENGGHPFISVRNIVNHEIDFSTARYISDEDYENAIKKCHPEKGDMLYSKGGTTGIAKLIDVDVEFANWVHVAVLKFHKDKLNGLFFENMLNSDYCYDQSQRLTKGIANRDLVLSAMAQIKMYRPPMNLQIQFADFVKQVNKSKVKAQKALDETQKLFDSLMQQYFG